MGKVQQNTSCYKKSTSFAVLDMFNGQYKPFTYAKSIGDCQHHCATYDSCTHFAFGKLDGSCHLVTATNPISIPMANFAAGPRTCATGDVQQMFVGFPSVV